MPFVLLFVFNLEVKVPTTIAAEISRRLSTEDYHIQFSELTLDKQGTLRFSDLDIRNYKGRRILTAEQLNVDLFLPSTLLGFPSVDRVEIKKVGLWNPLGPLGNDKPVAEILSIVTARKENSWQVEDFRATLEGLAIAASGNVRSSDWKAVLTQKTDRPLDQISDWNESIPKLFDQLGRLRDPFIQLNLGIQSGENDVIQISGIAERAELPSSCSLIGDIRFSMALRFQEEEVIPGISLLRADRFEKDEDLLIKNPVAGLRLPDHINDFWRYDGTEVFVGASSVITPTERFLHPSLSLSVARNLTLEYSGQTTWMGNPISISGLIDKNFQSIFANLSGLISIDKLLQHPHVPSEAQQPDLDFGDGLFLRASAALSRDQFLPSLVSFSAESESPMNLEGFEANYAKAIGTFSPRTMDLSVNHLSVDTSRFHLSGSYSHNFRSNRFRFLVDGEFFPSAINGWMRPWWEEFWADFVIPNPAFMNLDLEGDWDYRDARKLFGSISFNNIRLDGTPIDHGHARLWSKPYFFEIFDLNAFRPEGVLSGSLASLMNWENRDTFAYLYNIESTFSLAAVSPLLGTEVETIVDQFDSEEPPKISIVGTLLPEESKQGDPREKLVIKADTSNPLTFAGISLDSLSLKADYSNDLTLINRLEFGLAGGAGKAQLQWDETREDRCSLNLTYSGGCPASFVAAIPALAERAGEKFVEAKEHEDDLSRNLDFSIECVGDPERPESLVGEGSLELRTPNLANVRLLGILSRISEELPLPLTLGSFEFQRAEADFLLNRGLIEFNKFDLFSPTSKVAAFGSYDMEKQEVDFDAQMELLGEVKFPILAQIGFLLSPIGKVFEFRVFGPIDDMKWRLYLDPRSW